MGEELPEVVKTFMNELQATRLQTQELMSQNQGILNELHATRLQTQELMNRVFQPNKQNAADVPTYIPIEVDDFVTNLENYLFYEELNGIKNCFTVISANYAISFNHGPHEFWSSNPADNQTVVIISNQQGQKFTTKVVECDRKVDFVVVQSEVPLVSTPPIIADPKKLERYVLLGYPYGSTNYQALEGIFSSVDKDDQGRIRGSSGSIRGYSGGPVFNYKGELLGINVANESARKFIGFTGDTTVNEVVEELTMTFPCCQ